jgi:hypothetical protein
MAISDSTTATADSTDFDTDGSDGSTSVYHWYDSDYEKVGDGDDFCYVHQILACLDNSPYEVFNNRRHTHHETAFKRDNRPETVSVRTITEHNRLHSNGEWTEVDGEPRLVMEETPLNEYGVGAD